ncbi:DNA-formamidopyrimidine glycosylase [Corynebacterium yudongzhengii]|uniref:Formamidopyrimidine-DNA glycosylase n=1 Tax=Corynebacterium yudongzhengii TaxID=2080740 RepID=A0A2U1T6N3_9CORY|nr:bifunctional DNA-formamidopyrimidine glycosylase/DNA-(apurinic or apyrimidinic site) lyase [Corynebacterium yudongzhengii]AWB82938.1 DNA-formamidopyrimidine glycosylase [Corynebacterium yudongzhengii]PWC01633.1 bifunctional DNA-formamidopyrimidine glycosylase/DNA-(apurinic or apyrimidinic site) lyase [Corynebacterium yudongzhengii]
MPELPEVEVVRRGLDDHLIGARFDAVRVTHPRANRGQDKPLASLLVGRTVLATGRRGKYLWLLLDDHHALFIHLGMSGQMLVGTPGTCTAVHTRILADLKGVDGRALELAFVDQRTFGRWLYAPLVDGVPAPVAHIARDPLEPDFDAVATARRIRASRSPVKSVLLNQEIVSGIGNIYADEALFAAGIRPVRKAYRLRQKDTVNLLSCARAVMERALEAGGTSFDALYVNVNGASGYFSRSLNVYGRKGQPCVRCGGEIERVSISNRSSHFCPRCQRI